MVDEKKHLYIAIELKNRELDSQVVLAVEACKSDFRVYLGSHAAIFSALRSKQARAGIFLDKGTQRAQLTRWIKERCESIYILDQELGPSVEGAGNLQTENIISTRFYPDTKELIDGYFCVGPVIFDAAIASFDNKGIVHKSGWPRIDVQQRYATTLYEEKIRTLESQHGDFLLFVSDFGLLYPMSEMTDTNRMKVLLHAMPREDWDKTYRDFETTLKCLISWDNDPSVPKIIVRPHISEDIRIWKKALAGLKKTSVIHEGEITPWIVASSGVIQRGSTVSIQAKVMKKTVFYLEKAATAHRRPRVAKVSDHIVSEISPPRLSMCDVEQKPGLETLLNEVIYMEEVTSSSKIVKVFLARETRTERPISRARVLLTYLSKRSMRRFLGLFRDELKWIFGSNSLLPQSRYILGGIRKRDLMVGIKVADAPDEIRMRCIGLNLWELESRK